MEEEKDASRNLAAAYVPLAAAIVLLLAFPVFAWVESVDLESFPRFLARTISFGLSVVFICHFAIEYVAFSYSRSALARIPEAIKDIDEYLADAESASKVFKSAGFALKTLHDSVIKESEEFHAYLKQQYDYNELFRSKEAEIHTLRLSNEELRLNIEHVKSIVVDYYDDLNRLIDLLNEQQRSPLVKALRDFDVYAQQLGIDRIIPIQGDRVIEGQHVIVSTVSTTDGQFDGLISDCVKWGFRHGSEILKPAQVTVFHCSDRDESEMDGEFSQA